MAGPVATGESITGVIESTVEDLILPATTHGTWIMVTFLLPDLFILHTTIHSL